MGVLKKKKSSFLTLDQHSPNLIISSGKQCYLFWDRVSRIPGGPWTSGITTSGPCRAGVPAHVLCTQESHSALSRLSLICTPGKVVLLRDSGNLRRCIPAHVPLLHSTVVDKPSHLIWTSPGLACCPLRATAPVWGTGPPSIYISQARPAQIRFLSPSLGCSGWPLFHSTPWVIYLLPIRQGEPATFLVLEMRLLFPEIPQASLIGVVPDTTLNETIPSADQYLNARILRKNYGLLPFSCLK